MAHRDKRLSLVSAVVSLLLLASDVMADSIPHAESSAPQHPLMVIEQHRGSVVQRIVADWTDTLATLPTERRLTPRDLSDALWTLRSDRLLAASLVGSLATLESILAEDRADRVGVRRFGTKSLGDTNVDLTYTPVNPCRIADTRNAGGALAANTPRTFDGFSSDFSVQGGTATNCGIPNGIAALAMNVYAVNPSNLGFIKVWPANGAEPAVSTVNYQVGIVAIATGAIVPVDSANSNRFKAQSPAQVDFIADVVGYFARPANYGGTHVITGAFATSGGGQNHTVSGGWSTVGGGFQNTASGASSTVGGGGSNVASGNASTVSGGSSNTASEQGSAIGGGMANAASGWASTIPGGQLNEAAGTYAFAAGYRAKALADGSIVFGDRTEADVVSNVANRFVVAASGGISMATNKNLSTGCFIAAGGGTWNCTSDRNAKRDFAAIDPQDILARVTALPIAIWRYAGEDAVARHIGPTAQDFRAAFGLGVDDRHIATVDADGVALAAIKGLNAKVEALLAARDAELALLRRELADLRDRLRARESVVAD